MGLRHTPSQTTHPTCIEQSPLSSGSSLGELSRRSFIRIYTSRKSGSSSTSISNSLKKEAAGNPTTLLKSPSTFRISIPPKPCTVLNHDGGLANQKESRYLNSKSASPIDSLATLHVCLDYVLRVISKVNQ